MPSPPFEKASSPDRLRPLQMLFRSKPFRAKSFVRALESKLADAATVESVTIETARDLMRQFRLQPVDVVPPAIDLYSRAATWVVAKDGGKPLSTTFLPHLQRLLSLADESSAAVHRTLAERRAIALLRNALSEGRPLASVKTALAQEIRYFELPPAVHADVLLTALLDCLTLSARMAVGDDLLTPDEEQTLASLSEQLGISLQMLPQDLNERLREAKDEWHVRHGPLEQVRVAFRLSDGEVCLRKERAQEMLRKTVRIATAYSGPTVRFRIMKGVYWRSGVVAHQPISREALLPGDTGDLCLTNFRLLFLGEKKSISVPFENIVDVDPYTDAVEIKRTSGAHLQFRLLANATDVKRFQIVLSRLLNGDDLAVPKPLLLPEELKALRSATEDLSLLLHRSPDEVVLTLDNDHGTNLNLDYCRAALYHVNCGLTRAVLSIDREISDYQAFVFLSVLDDFRSSLANCRGEPRPVELAARFQSEVLYRSELRQVVRDIVAKADLGADLARCRLLLGAAYKAEAKVALGRRRGRRAVLGSYTDALLGLCRQISNEGGAPNPRLNETLAEIERELVLEPLSNLPAGGV